MRGKSDHVDIVCAYLGVSSNVPRHPLQQQPSVDVKHNSVSPVIVKREPISPRHQVRPSADGIIEITETTVTYTIGGHTFFIHFPVEVDTKKLDAAKDRCNDLIRAHGRRNPTSVRCAMIELMFEGAFGRGSVLKTFVDAIATQNVITDKPYECPSAGCLFDLVIRRTDTAIKLTVQSLYHDPTSIRFSLEGEGYTPLNVKLFVEEWYAANEFNSEYMNAWFYAYRYNSYELSNQMTPAYRELLYRNTFTNKDTGYVCIIDTGSNTSRIENKDNETVLTITAMDSTHFKIAYDDTKERHVRAKNVIASTEFVAMLTIYAEVLLNDSNSAEKVAHDILILFSTNTNQIHIPYSSAVIFA